MIQADVYRELEGTRYVLAVLDDEEQQLLKELQDYAQQQPDWAVYRNFYIDKLGAFYEARGFSRREITDTPLWHIAQDIGGRLHVASGLARASDYRGELELLIQTKFGSRRAFCQATGLSEAMLSHVLANRKNFSIDTLAEALGKIGYALHIVPLPESNVN